MVVHQAKALAEIGERITMVNGYIPADPRFPDYTRYDQLTFADPLQIATTEYSRHIALHAQRLIDCLIVDEDPFGKDRAFYGEQLNKLSLLFGDAAKAIKNYDKAEIEHFGD